MAVLCEVPGPPRVLCGSGGRPCQRQAVEKLACNIQPGLCLDFPEAGRAGDVNFCEVVADHIEADEVETALPEGGPNVISNPLISLCERLDSAGTPGGEIAPALACKRDSCQRPRHSFSVDHQNSFVTLLDGR